jgi:glutathione S-transferase
VKLYNLERCPYCKLVRDKLDAMGLAYEKIEVPAERPARQEVFAVSGQWTVPVLVDGDVMLDDEEKILPYLERTYGSAKR